MNRLMKDMKLEEEDRRARGLPTERERFPDSDDEDMDDGENEDDDLPENRRFDITRARKVQDPSMEPDGSKWPVPR